MAMKFRLIQWAIITPGADLDGAGLISFSFENLMLQFSDSAGTTGQFYRTFASSLK
jgi:hypothetical protein